MHRKEKNISKEKISIVIPCYNHGNYIADAIKSVLNQTYNNYEVFVFDNGSIDNSWEVICSFDDPRIKKIRLFVNDILEVKRQFIKMATGNYCAILYSDDVWKVDKLAKQMEFLKKNKEARICFTWAQQVDENLNPYNGFVHYELEKNKNRHGWWMSFLNYANQLSCPSMICEKSIYEKYFVRLYPYRQIADMFCWMKILEETNLYIVEEVLTLQRVHENGENKNESARTPENLRRENMELEMCLFKIIDEMDRDTFYRDFCGISKRDFEFKTNIELLCDKFIYFLKDDSNIYDNYSNAIKYYMKYFDYDEDGIVFYQYLADNYEFSRNDFFNLSGHNSKKEEINESKVLRWRKLATVDFNKIKIPNKMIIYGCGDIGKVLYDKVKNKSQVIQFIDSGAHSKEYDGIQIVGIEEAKINSEIQIVVVPSYDMEKIKKQFNKLYNMNNIRIISIEELLENEIS